MLQFAPAFAEALDPITLAVSGINQAISEKGQEIAELVAKINEAYSATHGGDLIKSTNKTTAALTSLTKPIKNFGAYKNLLENLYFLFWEGPASRVEGRGSQSFKDINELRTALQHDVDHGKAGKVKRKKLKQGATFEKYSGVTSPGAAAPERFPVLQMNILRAIASDLQDSPPAACLTIVERFGAARPPSATPSSAPWT